MDKLPGADRNRVSDAGHAEGGQVLVRQHRSRRYRRHAAMHGVEAVRAVHEISRTLRRAADAAELRDALRLHTHFIHRVNDALGNRVMPATGTERRLPAPIVDDLQSDAVSLWSWSRSWSRSSYRRISRCGPHVTYPPSS